MIVTREREKLLAAMVFFCQKTQHCHTLKLFKLLSFLDFEHYRQTGRTVTGLQYAAFEKGPVPADLWREMLDKPGSDLVAALSIAVTKDEFTGEVTRRDIRPRVAFNASLFSKRELAIMDRVAEFFRDLQGNDMSEVSHMRKFPWRKVYGRGEGRNKPIPVELALSSDSLVYDVPTIDAEEVELRSDLRRGVG